MMEKIDRRAWYASGRVHGRQMVEQGSDETAWAVTEAMLWHAYMRVDVSEIAFCLGILSEGPDGVKAAEEFEELWASYHEEV